MNVSDFEVGFKASESIKISDAMVRKFAEMSGDFNPIHLDDNFAATTRFKKRIAHGMILGALTSRVLNEKFGGGGVYLGQSLQFTYPVYIDDEVTIELELKKLHKTRGLGQVETTAKNQNGDTVMKGEATIMMQYGIKS